MILIVQPFFNELNLLEIKLNTLAGVVDRFLVCEATHTYTGIPKPLYFQESKERFKDFPIHHLVVESLPGEMNPWLREDHQRKMMYEEAMRFKPSVTVWNDTDEILRPSALAEFLASGHPAMGMECDWLRYYFNRAHPMKWLQPVINRDGRHLVTARGANLPTLKDAGWHFNFCTNRPMLVDKLLATSHAVDHGAPAYLARVRSGENPDLDCTVPYDEDRLPRYIIKHRERFSDLFWKEGMPLY